MLSRATSLHNIAILRYFTPRRSLGRLQEDLRNELRRLSFLDESTRVQYEDHKQNLSFLR